MADLFEQTILFAEVLRDVVSMGGVISPQIPMANWRYVKGNFTPEQLRIIADQIEFEFKG